MKLTVEQIEKEKEKEEEVIVCCHDTEAEWVQNVREAALGEIVIVSRKYVAELSLFLQFSAWQHGLFIIPKKS